ncbi:hypothetical protein D3C78_1468420 [compost metagenome]
MIPVSARVIKRLYCPDDFNPKFKIKSAVYGIFENIADMYIIPVHRFLEHNSLEKPAFAF